MDPHLPQNPVYPPDTLPLPLPLPLPSSIDADLPTTISLLNDLAAGAESALKSSFLSFPDPSGPPLIPCPFNPRHRLPPESLFRHSLRCPSGSPLPDLDFLQHLHYTTNSARSSSENSFLTDPAAAADLCFSLDGNLLTNFFYRDCPGVVCFGNQDCQFDSTKTFTLPAVLSAECANFLSERNLEASEVERVWILPSELWALKGEVEAWRDNPASYSYVVLRVVSCLCRIKECSFKKWVVSNSPRFGVLIDSAMGGHLFLLLKLCLKAIRREACCALELVQSKNEFVDPRSVSFECPHLVGSLTWLASQLSLLYGETNGKLFALGMLKESLLRAGSSSMFFLLLESVGRCLDGDIDGGEDDSSGPVFVSQIAASIAALHERFLLEERIKDFRSWQQISLSQRMNEHVYVSTRAREERRKRPNYRPVVEHDGLLLHPLHNLDLGKVKTREELLAEERDYKRRRMSYRGKTMKRTPIEVIRKIIEEHMEAIKQLGGIGCSMKISANTVVNPANWNCQSDTVTSDFYELRRSKCDPNETRLGSLPHRRLHQAECKVTSRMYKDDSSIDGSRMSNDHQKLRSDCSEYLQHQMNENCGKERVYRSKSPLNCGSNSQLLERDAYQIEQGDGKLKNECDRSSSGYSSRSKDYSSRSGLTSSSAKDTVLEISTRKGRRTSRSRRSESLRQDTFNDRYNPSESCDRFDTSHTTNTVVSVGSNYIRKEQFHHPK